MTILVTGATGTVGSRVLRKLSGQGVAVRALSRDPTRAEFPAGVIPIRGDLLDVGYTRDALDGISTLFLLNAVSPTELTEALLTLNLAREAGIERVVYLSAFHADRYADVPHFAAKVAVERMITGMAIPATILRPNCFMQNDVRLKDALLGRGLYPFPIGGAGVSMVDVRDVAEVAAHALLARERSGTPLPGERINVVGPDVLTGEGNAATWSSLLDRPIQYGGDDLSEFEGGMSARAPSWMALDIRLMLARFQSDGMAATPADVDALTQRLGRRPHSYAAFVAAMAAEWVLV